MKIRLLRKRFLSLALASAVLLTGCGGRAEQAGVPSKIVGEAVEGSAVGPGEAPAAEAVTMHLQKAEGTVTVADGEGTDVPLLEQMGLYSGYQVDTREESYAWIDLDSVKLTKMDVNSQVGIQKDGKRLGIYVHTGSLFFHVTEPLAEDESLDIRTSNMMVGIRGTCGWVNAADPGHMSVGILEGVVSCSVGNGIDEMMAEAQPAEPAQPVEAAEPARSAEVAQPAEAAEAVQPVEVAEPARPVGTEESAQPAEPRPAEPVHDTLVPGDITSEIIPGGCIAEISFTEDGQPQITVRELTVKDIPDFVLAEVSQDPELCEKILAETGLDVLNREPDWATALEGIAYYGDVAQCAMTREQAEAFAEALRGGMEDLEAAYARYSPDYAEFVGEFRYYAGLFDPGDGIPALMFGGGAVMAGTEARKDGASSMMDDHQSNFGEIWQYIDGEAVRTFPKEETNMRVKKFYLYPDFLRYDEAAEGDGGVSVNIYRFGSGFITGMPDVSAAREIVLDDYTFQYRADGSIVSAEEYDRFMESWGGQWAQGYLAGVDNGQEEPGDANIAGLCPAEDVLAVLDNS